LIHPADFEDKLDKLESQTGGGLPELEESYEEIYKMNTQQAHIRKMAQAVLKWLMIPLIHVRSARANHDTLALSKVETTIDAISLRPDGSRDPNTTADFILDICSNLVIIKEETSSFQFAHCFVVGHLLHRRITRNGVEL